jgi:hypothetical protein
VQSVGGGAPAGPKIVTLEKDDPRRAQAGVPAGEERPIKYNTDTGDWEAVAPAAPAAAPKIEKLGGVDHVWNPKTGKYEPYVDPATGKPPEAPMFPDSSVEGRALNHMVTSGTLTKDQAANLATGKTITAPDGRILFFSGSELMGVDPVTKQATPYTGSQAPPPAAPAAPPAAAPAGPAVAPPSAAPATRAPHKTTSPLRSRTVRRRAVPSVAR